MEEFERGIISPPGVETEVVEEPPGVETGLNEDVGASWPLNWMEEAIPLGVEIGLKRGWRRAPPGVKFTRVEDRPSLFL